MKQALLQALIVAGLVCPTTILHAQQIPLPTTAAQVPGPAPGTAMTKAYVQTVGRMAYLWGWALVNNANRHKMFSEAPEPGLLGGVLPVAHNSLAMLTNYISADQRFVTCTNQDVVYGFGFFDNLDKEPIFFQVPDFGDRFWVFALWDGRTDELMIVGPGWKGETPAGIQVSMLGSECWEPPPRTRKSMQPSRKLHERPRAR
jgi:hypothetical protein